MMNQETFVNIKSLREQGWAIGEIADETGFGPATVSKHLRAGPPAAKRMVPDESKVMNARWAERCRSLIAAHPRLLGVSVWRCLTAEGFAGGYSTVTRELRRIRGGGGASVPGCGSGVGPDPYRSGRGSPVRFLRPRRVGSALGPAGSAAVFRDDHVLVASAGLVVHHERGPPAHVRGNDPVLRHCGRDPRGVPHGSDGSAGVLPRQAVRAGSADGRFRGASRNEDHLVQSARREAQGHRRAPVPPVAGHVVARAASPRRPRVDRRPRLARGAVAGRERARRCLAGHRRPSR